MPVAGPTAKEAEVDDSTVGEARDKDSRRGWLEEPGSELAIASAILGVLAGLEAWPRWGIVFRGSQVGLLLAIVAIGMGLRAIRRLGHGHRMLRALALVGVLTGGLVILFNVLLLVVLLRIGPIDA